MGFDTYVNVGDRTVVQYRKQTGSLPRFLFKRDDLAIKLYDAENVKPIEVAFTSTASEVLGNLEEQGLGWEASVASYATVRDGSFTEAALSGRYQMAHYSAGLPSDLIYERTQAQLEVEKASSPENDLTQLGCVLAEQWLDPENDDVLIFSELQNDEPIEVTATTLIRALDAAESAGRLALPVSRAVEAIGLLFREARLVAWPLLITILLQQLDPKTKISYVLSEAIDEFDMNDTERANIFIDQYWNETAAGIANYARNLGVLFGTLSNFETRLGLNYWFGQAAAALRKLDELNAERNPGNAKSRGDALERLMEAIFQTESPHLKVTEKNFSTKEEEIDLVLTNNLTAPFWISQGSPYIFVECKNWKDPVGVAELRTFESKIDDRKAIVRIGIFVSNAGYYTTFAERLKIVQTKNIGLIYAITLADIRDLIARRERLFDWLLGDGAIRAFNTPDAAWSRDGSS